MRTHGIMKDTRVGGASAVDEALDCIVFPGGKVRVTAVLVEVLTGAVESELELAQ